MILHPEARQILIEPLAFKNANSQCKKVIGHLKARSVPIVEWNWERIGSGKEKKFQDAHVNCFDPELDCTTVTLPSTHSPYRILRQREDNT